MDYYPMKLSPLCTMAAVAMAYVVPLVAAKFMPACAGMALCMMLFLAIYPICSIALGVLAGLNIRKSWHLPLAAAVAFLSGAWILIDMGELQFIIYAVAYLSLGVIAMLITYFLKKS